MPPKSKLGICSRILRPIQTKKGICWFLAVIVVMFYSQRSRKVIMKASKTWNRQNKVIKLFIDLLYDRYLTVGSDPYKDEEYETFNEDTFIEILQRLYDMDSSNFPINPKDDDKGYYVDSYLCKLYTLLGVDYKAFDYDVLSQDISYSSINKEFDSIYKSISNTIPHSSDLPYLLDPNVGVYKDDGQAPSILIISRFPLLTPFANNKIVDDDIKRELISMKQKITYNGVEYNLDSVHISDMEGCNHSIVGMTCKQKKFIFNGHPLNNKFPCILIPHNWNIRNDRDFYLSSKDCKLHDKPQPESWKYCYNFSKGYNRGFIYVRKNASSGDTSNSLEEDVEKYFETRKDTLRLEEEEMKVRKPNISRFARRMTPLYRLIPSLFPNREGIETARLRQEEEQRKKEAVSRERKEEQRRLFEEEQRIKEAVSRKRKEEQWKLFEEEERKKKEEEQMKLFEEEQRKKEAVSRERKEEQRRLFEEEERKKKEKQKKQQELQKEEKQLKRELALIKEENMLYNKLKYIETFMAQLKLDSKRKRKSNSPKLITRTSPKKQKKKRLQ